MVSLLPVPLTSWAGPAWAYNQCQRRRVRHRAGLAPAIACPANLDCVLVVIESDSEMILEFHPFLWFDSLWALCRTC
jgi:hypothetical protein